MLEPIYGNLPPIKPNDHLGHFPPNRPNFTVTEDLHATRRLMEDTIKRLLQFEERIKNDYAEMTRHLQSDNVLFKDTMNTAYITFQTQVSNEVNSFESNVDNIVALFKSTMESSYSGLSDTVSQSLAQYLTDFTNTCTQFETNYTKMLNDYKTELNKTYSDFRESTENRLERYNSNYIESFNNYVTNTNAIISTMERKFAQDYNNFTNEINEHIQEFENEWTNSIDAKLNELTGKLNDGILYMKTNLISSVTSEIEEMVENGKMNEIINEEVFGDLSHNIDMITTFVNVKDFGAIGDGVTNDTLAFQQAIESGNNVYIPNGVYLIRDSLSINNPYQKIKGESLQAEIKADSILINPVIILSGENSAAYRSYQELKELTITGHENCVGLQCYKNADFTLERVKISGCEIGFESKDSLIYNVKEMTISSCVNAIVFRDDEELAPANNVRFESCRIFANKNYCILAESGGSTHGVIFDTCEFEQNNVDKNVNSAFLLESIATSGELPLVTFNNCWFENNQGMESVFIFNNVHTNYPCYIFTGNTFLNDHASMKRFIDATNISLYISHNHNPSTYLETAIKLTNSKYYNFGCTINHETDGIHREIVVGYDGYIKGDFNFVGGKGTHYQSQGGTGDNYINSHSNYLYLKSELGKVELDGEKGVNIVNTFEKPLQIGQSYLWTYGENVYVKYNSLPESATDGYILLNTEYNGNIPNDFNFNSSKGIHFISQGGTGDNYINSFSNHLSLTSELGRVTLEGGKGVNISNTFEKPLHFGMLYIWNYGKNIYGKYNALPESETDGKILLTVD